MALQVRVELAELSPLLRVLWSTWAHYARAGRVLRRGQQQPLIKPVQISAWFLLVYFHELLRRPRLGALKPLLLLLYRQVRLLVYLFYFLVGVSHRLALVNKPCSLKANGVASCLLSLHIGLLACKILDRGAACEYSLLLFLGLYFRYLLV